jgi:hypothetical protein
MHLSRRGFLSTLAGSALAPSLSLAAAPKPRGTSLFDGKSLAAWDTWLGIPHKHVTGLEHPRNPQGEYTEVLGLNKDPKQVFTVASVDGEPAIRISGEIFGALTSKEEFGDFHLSLEYKWGEKKWPPKDKAARDSGLLYYCVGEHGLDGRGKFWMRSLECQIQEHDTGDFWSLVGVTVDVRGQRQGSDPVRYDPKGTRFTVPGPEMPRRVFKSEEIEKENTWNQVEVLCLRGTCVHAVNGKVNMVLENPRLPAEAPGGKPQPLRRGRFQIQSEGAEVFYRRLTVRPLRSFPAAYRPT